MMTSNAIKKIEEKIHKDGSLTEEKKIELLNLLAAMNAEVMKTNKTQADYVLRMTRLNKRPTLSDAGNKRTHQHF